MEEEKKKKKKKTKPGNIHACIIRHSEKSGKE